MIHKNATYGKVKDLTLLEFGTGDIKMNAIMYGLVQSPGEVYSGVAFTNDTPHEIGSLHHGDIGKTIDDLQPQTLMLFTKVGSIDALIGSLQEARKNLVELLDA